ncbi:MAG: energy transducer TonB [Rikenellaceae bacterium]|nr:energy transducer TonB [Rikenellaceae bacterium]MCL2693430.1 energy transducer TonB [Rikenellaceae bacterium]
MYYYDENDNDRTGRRTGVLAMLAYFAFWVLLLLVVKFSFTVRETGEGILIAFGDTEVAGGDGRSAAAPTPASPAAQEVMTQDFEDAPQIVQPQENVQRPPERPTEQTTPPVEEPPREPDRRALFPGSNNTGESDSRGTGEGAGQQGAQEGTPDADPAGTGAGAGGTSFSLAGRSVTGSLPAPRYPSNKSGRVVVDITVDASGRVIRAVPRGQGSTTNDSELINAALEAAGRARFNVVESDGLQTGTITYNFILK